MKKLILIIDDSPTQLSGLKAILSRAGYEIKTVNNGVEGFAAAYELFPDLIISDIIMPEIDGYQLCRLLKNDRLTQDIPIILLTNYDERLHKFWGLRAGADAYVVKDSNFNALLQEVERILSNATCLKEEDRQKLIREQDQDNDIYYMQSRINSILDKSLIESTIINEFRNLSELIQHPYELNKRLFVLISAIIDCNIIGIFCNDKDDRKEKIVSFSIYDINPDKNILTEIKNDFFKLVFSDEFDEHKDLYSYEIFKKTIGNNIAVNQVSDFQSKVIIPMSYGDKIFGGICLYNVNPNKYESSKIFNIVIEELKLLMKIKWLYCETKFLTMIDSLTGIYNRRYFQQAIEREYARARRYHTELSIFMLDIDHFKSLNDTCGHQFGDTVILEITKIIKSSLRKTDYLSRYGGDELVGILPETSPESASIPIDRIRKKIENLELICNDKVVKINVSIGIAGLTNNITSECEFLEKADLALYEAKEGGRGRTVFAKED